MGVLTINLFRLASLLLAFVFTGTVFLTVVSPTPNPRTSTLLITADAGGNGSGVLINHRMILTAKHVAVYGEQTQLFVVIKGKRFNLHERNKSLNTDLAILESDEDMPGDVAEIATSDPGIGTPVTAVGFPLNNFFQTELTTRGYIVGETDTYTFSDAVILPGNSGGGLYYRGELVGITVAAPVVPLSFTYIPAFTHSVSIPLAQVRYFLKYGV